MPSALNDERLVCAVLSAQVAELRDRIDTSATVDLMWRTMDVLSSLSDLVLALSRLDDGPDPTLKQRCCNALVAAAEISGSLDKMAFIEAQRQDFSRQMADCVATALDRLAVAEASAGGRLSALELAGLYVSEDQRRVHEAVASRFGADACEHLPPDSPQAIGNEGNLE